MATILPTIPYWVFCVLEPISLVAGFVVSWYDPADFVQTQLPQTRLQSLVPVSANAKIVALQLGNLYGLMCLLGLTILNITSEPRVVRGYLACLAIADIGHVAPTLYYMGWDHGIDIASWNSVELGNVLATALLFVTRVLYLIGAFGEKTTPSKGKRA